MVQVLVTLVRVVPVRVDQLRVVQVRVTPVRVVPLRVDPVRVVVKTSVLYNCYLNQRLHLKEPRYNLLQRDLRSYDIAWLFGDFPVQQGK